MNPDAPSPAASGAPTARADRTIETAAARWVDRETAGLDVAGRAELAAWRAQDPRHAEAFGRLKELADALRRARERGFAGPIAAQLAARQRRRARRRVLAGAAAAAVLAAAGISWWPGADAGVREAHAAAPAETVRRLPDGTVVELNGDARIEVAFAPALRRVELRQGEALFRVAPDAERPFVVRAGGIDVRAVGTAFSVRMRPAALEILVTEGRVNVDDVQRGESLLPRDGSGAAVPLTVGHFLVVEPPSSRHLPPSVQLAQLAPEAMQARLAWRVPHLALEGTALADAVAQMNRGNRLQISLADDSLRDRRVSGTFRTDDPETFARLVAATFDLRVERRDDGGIVLHAR